MYDSTGAHSAIPGPPLFVSTATFVYVKSNKEHFRLRLAIFDFFFFYLTSYVIRDQRTPENMVRDRKLIQM